MTVRTRSLWPLLAALLLLTASAVARATTTVGGVPVVKHCVEEPVFGGQACVYQANLDAHEAVVLVPGLNGEGLRDWRKQIPLLARRYHVLTLDLPGFGRSEKQNRAYTPANYVRFLHYIARRFLHGPFHLVGHSLGAAVSLEYAARYPADVRRLVLTDSAGILYGQVIAKYMAGAWANKLTGHAPAAPNPIGRLVGKVLEEIDQLPLDPERIIQNKRKRQLFLLGDPAAIASAALGEADFSRILPQVQAPTLIVWGGEDPVVPVRTGRVLEQALPKARLEVIPGVQHVPMSQAPVAYNMLLWHHLTAPRAALAFTAKLSFPARPPSSQRVGRCENQSGVRFSGEFRRLDIVNCDDVEIRDAWIGSLHAKSSRIQLWDSAIVSTGVGLRAEGSEVMVTNSRIQGAVAMHLSGSRLDIAHTELRGDTAAAEATREAVAVFSVSHVRSPHGSGTIHGQRVIARDRPL